MKRNIAIALVAGVCIVPLAFSQFGIPSVVFDPAADAHWIQEIAQALRTYRQVVQTYQTTVSLYEQIQWNAKAITGKESWRYIMAPLMYPSATSDMYGTTGGWLETLNTGLAATQNYERATMRASSPAGMYGLLSSNGQAGFSSHYSTVEINDAAAQQAMQVTGSARAALEQQNAAIAALQDSSLSDLDDDNTEVGVLNKINSASMIHAQGIQGTNQLLSAMADQQTVELKMRHDVLVDEMNSAIAAQAAKTDNTEAIWGGNTDAKSVRLP